MTDRSRPDIVVDPWTAQDPETLDAEAQLQSRITAEIREVDAGALRRARLELRDRTASSSDRDAMLAALAAAAHDERIWAALMQVRQVVIL